MKKKCYFCREEIEFDYYDKDCQRDVCKDCINKVLEEESE